MLKHIMYVVDSDTRRANAICQAAAKAKATALPFESCNELRQRWPSEGTCFVSDEGNHFEDALSIMRETGLGLPLVSYGSEPDAQRVALNVRRGASDFLKYPFSAEDLTQCLARLREGWSSITDRNARVFKAIKQVDELSPRETVVLDIMSEGCSTKSIARALGISHRTVEIHRRNIIRKLDTETSLGAVKLYWDARVALR